MVIAEILHDNDCFSSLIMALIPINIVVGTRMFRERFFRFQQHKLFSDDKNLLFVFIVINLRYVKRSIVYLLEIKSLLNVDIKRESLFFLESYNELMKTSAHS